jgi:hypothetical protein
MEPPVRCRNLQTIGPRVARENLCRRQAEVVVAMLTMLRRIMTAAETAEEMRSLPL